MESKSLDIGSVIYRQGIEPGTLEATWCHSIGGQGTGIATGGPATGFVGRYIIRYFNQDGQFDVEFILKIAKNGDLYDVSWFDGDKVIYQGLGMVVEGRLVVGWRGIDEITGS